MKKVLFIIFLFSFFTFLLLLKSLYNVADAKESKEGYKSEQAKLLTRTPISLNETLVKDINKKYGRYSINWVKDSKHIIINETIDNAKLDEQMLSRRTHLGNQCQIEPELLSLQINSKEFVINSKFKLIWCNIFKSASSTWIYHFLRMKDIEKSRLQTSRKNPIEHLRTVYPRPCEADLKTVLADSSYKSLLVVREPFHRLLSAFFDKIQSKDQMFFDDLRCSIVKEFGKRKAKSPCSATFPQFVNYIISEHSKGNKANEHWAPFYSFCSACQVNYDFILHFETLPLEEKYFINKTSGLSEILEEGIVVHSASAKRLRYDELAEKYFSDLDLNQLRQLIIIYRLDFVFFDYSFDKYFSYVHIP